MHFSAQAVLLLIAVTISQSLNAQESNLVYPKSKTVEQVDDFHGTKVEDPYRWLEDDVRTSKEVADWLPSRIN